MQRVTINAPDAPPVNKWLATRRNYLIRKFYALFAQIYTDVNDQHGESSQPLSEQPQQFAELKSLGNRLFNENNHPQQQSPELDWTVQALHHEALQLRGNIKLYQSHSQDDAWQSPLSRAKQEAIPKQLEELYNLLNKAKDLLEQMLVEQTSNDLLLRLLIEEELGQKLWQKSTAELFNDMFPYQPEVGYVIAGKSYFMAQWLEEALMAYEQSLAINNDLSEPRRQTYLIRGMIRDRSKAKN